MTATTGAVRADEIKVLAALAAFALAVILIGQGNRPLPSLAPVPRLNAPIVLHDDRSDVRVSTSLPDPIPLPSKKLLGTVRDPAAYQGELITADEAVAAARR